MNKWFCDFCGAEVDGAQGAAVFDSSIVLEGRKVIIRAEVRETSSTVREVERPDICSYCRDRAVAIALGLTVTTNQEERK